MGVKESIRALCTTVTQRQVCAPINRANALALSARQAICLSYHSLQGPRIVLLQTLNKLQLFQTILPRLQSEDWVYSLAPVQVAFRVVS